MRQLTERVSIVFITIKEVLAIATATVMRRQVVVPPSPPRQTNTDGSHDGRREVLYRWIRHPAR
jgi:hypothetical protein